MRSQEHNRGQLKQMTIEIEEDILKNFEEMSRNTGISIDILVLIAMKRFKSSHVDYQNRE